MSTREWLTSDEAREAVIRASGYSHSPQLRRTGEAMADRILTALAAALPSGERDVNPEREFERVVLWLQGQQPDVTIDTALTHTDAYVEDYGIACDLVANNPDLAASSSGGGERELRGVELIAAERRRQVEAEGWTSEHDDAHRAGELAYAAACYATPRNDEFPRALKWPFESDAWKPSPDDRVRELVKAGALIAAEIDRLLRVREVSSEGEDHGE